MIIKLIYLTKPPKGEKALSFNGIKRDDDFNPCGILIKYLTLFGIRIPEKKLFESRNHTDQNTSSAFILGMWR